MFEQRDNDLKSKAELAREAREERLARENKGGKKAPLHLKSRTYGYIMMAFGVVVLIFAVLWGMISFGFAQQYLPAAQVGSETVSVAEYNFIYNGAAQNVANYAQQMGMTLNLDEATPLAQKEGQTWRELIADFTNSQLKSVYVGYAKAKEKGITLTDKELESIDKAIEDFKAGYASNVDFSNALVSNWGKGVNESVIRELTIKQTLADKYQSKAPEDIQFTDEEIDKFYNDNKAGYDVYDFLFANLTVAAKAVPVPEYPDTSNETDNEKLKELNEKSAKMHEEYQKAVEEANNAAKEQAATLAEEAKSKIKDEASFIEFVKAHEDILSKEQAMRAVSPYRYQRIKDMISNSEVATYLAADERKAGDFEALNKDSANVTLVMFMGRGRDEVNAVDGALRVITAGAAQDAYKKANNIAESESLTDEQKAEAMQAASEALTAYFATNKTKEDISKNEVEGYFSTYLDLVQFAKSTNPFIADLGAWMVDAERKEGDSKVFIDDLYGVYGVTYFKNLEIPGWKTTVRYREAKAKFQEEFENLLKEESNEVKAAWGERFTDLLPFMNGGLAA